MERNLLRLRRHNDLVFCQLIDPLEMSPPAPGIYGITDGYQQTRIDTRNSELRRRYDEIFQARRERWEQLARRLQIPLLKLVSGTDTAGIMRRGLSLKHHVAPHP